MKWQHLIDKLEGAYADKTIAGYRADFADLAAWARRKRLAALPAVAATLARYVDEIGERLKPSSVRRKLSATQREDAVEEGLALFVTWNPKRLAKLIVVLRHISSRELADRLES